MRSGHRRILNRLPTTLRSTRDGHGHARERRIGVMLAALVVAIVLIGTLRPTSDEISDPAACFLCSDRGLADAIVNVLLFTPFGVALAMLVAPARAVVAGFVLSFGIEVAQMWVPGRHTSAGDILFNTAGALVGVALFAALPWLLRPSKPHAAILAVIWSGLAAAVLFGGRALLAPADPASVYYGQWTAELGGYAHYDGRVLGARAGSVELRNWRLDDAAGARAAIASGVPIEVVTLAGAAPPTVAPIFSIADDQERQIMMLAADGAQLVYRYRTLAQEVRLDSPDLRVHDALTHVAPGDTLRLAVQRAPNGRAFALRVNDRVETRQLGIADTWGLLLSIDSINRRPGLRTALGFLWVAGLLAPAAFWGSLALRGASGDPGPGSRARPAAERARQVPFSRPPAP